MWRYPKRSCLDCGQSAKSVRTRAFLDCTDPLCCIKGVDIEPGSEGHYPVNRFCDRCLVNTYKYAGADWQPREKFICPRCRGLENPNKRKRVKNTEVAATLVLVKDREHLDSDARLPALRLFESGVVDFAKALPDNQRAFFERHLQLDKPADEENAVAPAATGAADAGSEADGADGPRADGADGAEAAAVASVVSSMVVKVGATCSLGFSTTQPRDNHILSSAPAASRGGSVAMNVDSAKASPTVLATVLKASEITIKQEVGLEKAKEEAEHIAADSKRYAPFLLMFSDDGRSFRIETNAGGGKTGSHTAATTQAGAGAEMEPFAWNARSLKMMTSVRDTDASKFDSTSQHQIWRRFRDLYDEEVPIMRVKAFTSRHAWKCPLTSPIHSDGGSLGDLPPMRVSLEVPACPKEHFIQLHKRNSRRLSKRTARSDSGVQSDTNLAPGKVMWPFEAPQYVQQMLAAQDDWHDRYHRDHNHASALTCSRVAWLSPRFALQSVRARETSSVNDDPTKHKKLMQTHNRKGKRRKHHHHRHRRTEVLVCFEDLSPARCYVADAATRPSDRARIRAEELRADGVLRYAQFGRLDPVTGLRYAPAQSTYAGDVKVAKQIQKMIQNPHRVEKFVGIFKITDRDHPAHVGRKSDEHPSYGALALSDLPSHTVLGAYGGLTKLDTEDESIDRSAERADCQFDLLVGNLFVDADRCCNQLAFLNDFRTDTVHYNDPTRQKGYVKCKGKAKNTRQNTEVLIAWKDRELFPRVFFITNRAVRAYEELMIDYGDAYWKHVYEQSQSRSDEVDSGFDEALECCDGSDARSAQATAVDIIVGTRTNALPLLASEAAAPSPLCGDGSSSDSESEIDLTGD